MGFLVQTHKVERIHTYSNFHPRGLHPSLSSVDVSLPNGEIALYGTFGASAGFR